MRQHSILITRNTDRGVVRYYRVELFPTLFGEFVVKREYGNVYFKAPSGIKKDFFDNFNSALIMFEAILKKK